MAFTPYATLKDIFLIAVFCIAYGDDADIYLLESLSDASGGFTKRGDPETIRSLYKTLSTYF